MFPKNVFYGLDPTLEINQKIMVTSESITKLITKISYSHITQTKKNQSTCQNKTNPITSQKSFDPDIIL